MRIEDIINFVPIEEPKTRGVKKQPKIELAE